MLEVEANERFNFVGWLRHAIDVANAKNQPVRLKGTDVVVRPGDNVEDLYVERQARHMRDALCLLTQPGLSKDVGIKILRRVLELSVERKRHSG